MDGEVLAVLIDEGVGGVPDPPKAVPLGRCSMEQLDVVKHGLGGIFKENLTVTILKERERNSILVSSYPAVLIVVIAIRELQSSMLSHKWGTRDT